MEDGTGTVVSVTGTVVSVVVVVGAVVVVAVGVVVVDVVVVDAVVVSVEVGVFSVLQQFVSHSVMTLVRCVNFESISCNHGMVQLSKVDTSPEM